jgi:citrate synthase
MSEFRPGLEGVVAFQTEIAEPDKEGGALRYRGVDIEDLVGSHPFEQVWGLLVDDAFEPGLPPAEPRDYEGLTGDGPADLQWTTARLGAEWGLEKLIDIDDEQAREDLRRLSAAMLSIAAQSFRVADGNADRVDSETVAQGKTAAERFLLEWRGEADPRHVQALDTYWICTAEHGLNASTFTARVTASTGADCAAALSSAVGALSGPLHGGAPARVLPMLDAAAEAGDPARYVEGVIERKERLMGFGHRVYRAEDPRARLLRGVAKELGSPRFEVAEELERAALAALRKKSPDRPLETNVEFWSAVVLDVAEVPPPLAPAMFACSRTAGWSAHILEQKREAKLVRPAAQYVGPGSRSAADVRSRAPVAS